MDRAVRGRERRERKREMVTRRTLPTWFPLWVSLYTYKSLLWVSFYVLSLRRQRQGEWRRGRTRERCSVNERECDVVCGRKRREA